MPECECCTRPAVGQRVHTYVVGFAMRFSPVSGRYTRRQVAPDGRTVTWTYDACAEHLR